MMRQDIAITVLVDNEAGEGLSAEHGLALWITVGDRRILFDTGQGSALLPNARRLGVPLEQAETIVISHGHYDHTGALDQALTQAPQSRLVMHPEAIATRYSVRPPKAARAVDMPRSVQMHLEQWPDTQVTYSTEPVRLTTHIGVTGPVPRATSFEDVGGPFFLDKAGTEPDPIVDDQSLWIATPEGLIVCAGCCHAGLINTLRYIQAVSGVSRVRAVIGGFHLVNADSTRLHRTIEALRQIGPARLIPCHCTGPGAIDALQAALGDIVTSCRSGDAFHFKAKRSFADSNGK
jgi:7,8-dihydropterin-6-yl-methyl-4-(beta-D-ribofuranosyl)aminobenzene 5'-phosphate synthase